jgi:hypothetical protein
MPLESARMIPQTFEELKALSIDETLKERASRYGVFELHADVTQKLKSTMWLFKNGSAFDNLSADQKEALEMIQHKIGRVLNGDPNYIDSWVDIEGYARLVSERIRRDQSGNKAKAGLVAGTQEGQSEKPRASTLSNAQTDKRSNDIPF